MKPDYHPIALISNTVANGFDPDNRGRDVGYIPDPEGWVHQMMDLLWPYHRAGFAMFQGFTLDGEHAIYGGCCRSGVTEAAGLAIADEECERRRAAGKINVIYNGGQITPSGQYWADGCPILDWKDPRAWEFARREWTPWHQAGVTEWFLDWTSGTKEVAETAQALEPWGIKIGREALPLLQLDDGTLMVDQKEAAKCAHFCSMTFKRYFDPQNDWAVDWRTSECHIHYNDWDFLTHPYDGTWIMKRADILGLLIDLELDGFIIGGMSALPEVQEWILNGPFRWAARLAATTELAVTQGAYQGFLQATYGATKTVNLRLPAALQARQFLNPLTTRGKEYFSLGGDPL